MPDRTTPPTGPKQGASLCRLAQFTLALAGELFHHCHLLGQPPCPGP
jgi:hypothetical protein